MPNTKDEPVKKKRPKREKGYSVVNTSLRYLAMLEFIPRDPASVSVEKIMQMLDRGNFLIDKRSVQRDLPKLAVPFNLDSREDGKTKHWFYSENAPARFFPSMDVHTALSFQLVKANLLHLLPPETLKSLSPWFKKSEEILSQRSNTTSTWQEKIHVHPLGLARIPPIINLEIQQTIYKALLEERVLRIQYRRRNEVKNKEYLISPLGLIVRDYIIYVIGIKNESGEKRHFVLQRFKRAEIVEDAQYVRPKLFNLAAYAQENYSPKLGEAATVDLVLWMDNEAAISVAECPVSNRQELEQQEDGSFILKATLPNTVELKRWINSFGHHVEVRKPVSLRGKFADELAYMMTRYQAKKTSK